MLPLIGVIDLLNGRAVHARGGHRARYQPVVAAAGVPIAGDPLALGRVYVELLELRGVYVADLDAIDGGPTQDGVVRSLASLGAPLWVDAGAKSVADVTRALHAGAARAIVGLETLRSYASLRQLCQATTPERIAFSLDLRDGRPIIAEGAEIAQAPPADIASRAVDAGVGAVIVLDLARVGTGTGPALDEIAAVRKVLPHVMLIAGGGVGSADDLQRLRDSGCDAALVASALHDGRIDPRQDNVSR